MKIRIASAQYPISFFESIDNWKKHVKSWISEAVIQQSEIFLFPEYGSMELVSLFETDIQQNIQRQVEKLQTLLPSFIETFEKLAIEYQIIIIAPSFPVTENGKIYNRSFVFSKNGMIGFQDKFFMTRFENEIWGIDSGKKNLALFKTENFTFGIQICYDIEFAIGAQKLNQAGADFILVPSCTETIRGASRVHIGSRARAMENQCYTIVSQTIGNAEWSPAVDINYGFAAIYSSPDENLPEEGIVAQGKSNEIRWLIDEIDLAKNAHIRKNGQVFNFKDHSKMALELKNESIKIKLYQF
jgi:predicted amidohydrolase